MSESNGLPAGWTSTTVVELSELIRGVSYKKPDASIHYREGTVPILRAGNISRGLVLDRDLVFVPSSLVSEAQYLREGDVVLAMSSGSNTAVGKAAQARHDWNVSFGAFCGVLRPSKFIDYRYFGAFFETKGYRDAISQLAKGTNINNIRREHLQSLQFPLPPLEEQHRIVAAIEEQLSRLDASVSALEKAQANLKRCRTATLMAAMDGRLTTEWRQENSNRESAWMLLERILTKRRELWENEQLAMYEQKGKKPPKNWRSKYQDPVGPNTKDLPELESGWRWANIEQLGEVTGGLTKNQTRASLPLKLPYLRVANVYADELRLDEIQEIGIANNELDRVLLRKGDLLVVEGNGSPDQIGRVALWDGSIDPCVHQNHLIKVRFVERSLGKFILHWLLSASGREYIKRVASSTSGLYTLSISKVRALPVPLPPFAEQQEIVKEVEGRLSILRGVESEVDANLKRASRLRQSILKWAFEGKLVPQDPNDEPAVALLAKLREEKTRREQEARPTRRSKRKKTRGTQEGQDMAAQKQRRPIQDVLFEADAPLKPEELFDKAGFEPESIEDLYMELRNDVKSNRVEEFRTNNADVYLRAIKE